MKVVGLTGTICSGKETVKEIIKKKVNCYYVTISDIIRAEVEKKKGVLDRKILQDMGNEMRKNYGNHILAMLAIEYLNRDKEMIVIDGIRNPGEVDYLRKKFGNNFKLIAVDAAPEIRFERILKRGQKSDPKTWEEFVVMDERDKGKNEPEYGQQVGKCIQTADFVVMNDGTLEELENKLNEVIKNI
jgi:dephospho-CoA kinase